MNLTREMLRYGHRRYWAAPPWSTATRKSTWANRFARISMVKQSKYTGVGFDAIQTLEEARAAAKKNTTSQYEERHLKGDILNLFFDEFVEDKLIQPTFLTGHPVEISPLSSVMRSPRLRSVLSCFHHRS